VQFRAPTGQHPDRDAQFCYLNDQADAHLTSGHPVSLSEQRGDHGL
jgi:hypothetical protein